MTAPITEQTGSYRTIWKFRSNISVHSKPGSVSSISSSHTAPYQEMILPHPTISFWIHWKLVVLCPQIQVAVGKTSFCWELVTKHVFTTPLLSSPFILLCAIKMKQKGWSICKVSAYLCFVFPTGADVGWCLSCTIKMLINLILFISSNLHKIHAILMILFHIWWLMLAQSKIIPKPRTL